ncbi:MULTISPECIES: response regulator transcription factor [Chitinibacter]|uniref:response regulator transcription factor n=1 Tax=Chitinibacter TaxID=230666 RepID=UPI0004071010|nr:MULTISPECIES: response regulator transcription factor [Chitinibacter]
MSRILLIEDDLKLASLTSRYLSQQGLTVRCVHDGREALAAYSAFQPDLVILDVMLPGKDGWQICRELRQHSAVPLLMLTARDEQYDQILGLELGADDYVVKPVEPRLLLARIRAILRRQEGHLPAPAGLLQYGQLSIDTANRQVTLAGADIPLGSAEFELLNLLASQPGKVLSREQIIQALRGIEFDGLDRTVDVCVSKLRKKLGDDPREARRIKTVWGKGYLFSPNQWEG